jgi:insecticidal toxin complex protein TccC
MPKLIERHAVINEQTTDLTAGLKDQELFDAFFQKTPNGKSTQRILDAFGLKATKVTRARNNFLIEVE